MSRPSTAATLGGMFVLALFGLPFLGVGLLFSYLQLVNEKNLPPAQVAAGVGFGLVFAFIGAMLIYAVFFGYQQAKKHAEMQEANPNSPWMWRKDWAVGRAESRNKRNYITLWVVAVLCNVVSLPFVLTALPAYARDHNPAVFFTFTFSAIGMLVAIFALRATLRHAEYGDAYFEFEGSHFIPGERMAGKIQLKFDKSAEHGVLLRLSCIRKIRIGTGEHQSTRDIVLWQSERNVSAGAIAPGPLGRSIPVEFVPPAECPNTDHDNPSDQVLWMLHAEADVPGVDYKDDFELPFFGKAASADSFASNAATLGAGASSRFGVATTRLIDEDTGPVPRPACAKTEVSSGMEGTTFYFPPFRDRARALVLVGCTVFWTGMVYLMFQKQSPLFLRLIFGLADLLLIWGSLYVTLGNGRITVRNGEISWRRGILGTGRTHRANVQQIASIVAVLSPEQGPNTSQQQHTLRLRMKDGRKFALADQISSRQEARWLVSEIERLVGIQVDTHVETDLPLGISPLPGGMAPQGVFRGGRSNSSAAAPVLIFIMVTAGMVGFMIFRMSSVTIRRSAAKASAVSRTPSVPPRVFSQPLTDADEQRLRGLPVQAQAEELLERAIGHDEHARVLFDEEIASWTGRLEMSDRMKALERRAEFSKDLRVRYADEDLNLALQGWKKNEESAEALIERARSDKSYRSWAVYYLGMLAGRGVDYERIHGVLLDYVKHDPDPAVRQWAAEGMRFLGKDEVLDELFDVFTHDAATNVRNRAGCNISDCGTFTRPQRMRMVPKFLELANNPATSKYMRNWAFMALQEITDERLPANAEAWSAWYQQHGAEKMALFEKQDWWQVRGDE